VKRTVRRKGKKPNRGRRDEGGSGGIGGIWGNQQPRRGDGNVVVPVGGCRRGQKRWVVTSRACCTWGLSNRGARVRPKGQEQPNKSGTGENRPWRACTAKVPVPLARQPRSKLSGNSSGRKLPGTHLKKPPLGGKEAPIWLKTEKSARGKKTKAKRRRKQKIKRPSFFGTSKAN